MPENNIYKPDWFKSSAALKVIKTQYIDKRQTVTNLLEESLQIFIMICKYIGTDNPEESIKIINYFVNDGIIKASSPRIFNDPSEFKVKFNFKAETEVIKARFIVDNPSKYKHEFERWFDSFTDNNKCYIGYQTRQNLLNAVGVVCLTADDKNYLM